MTPEEAAAYWEELQRAHARRRAAATARLATPRTGEMRVTVAERLAMQAFYLLRGESYSALARRFRRDRHYMPRWIWEPRYREFHRYYWGDDAERITDRRRRRVAADDGIGAAT